MEILAEPAVRRHRITAEQYLRMGDAGVFEPDARVELIEGEVIDMAPIGTRHWSMVTRLNHLLVSAASGRVLVSVHQSLRLSLDTEPEPDIALGLLTARGARTSYAAVVARQMGKVCLVGCDDLGIDLERRRIALGGTELGEGANVNPDGHEGGVQAGARGRGGRRRVVWRPGPKAHSHAATAARPTS